MNQNVTLNLDLERHLWDTRHYRLIAISQGSFASILPQAAELNTKKAIKVANLMRECDTFYKTHADTAENEEKLAMLLTEKIGGDREFAYRIILYNDLSNTADDVAFTTASLHLSKFPNMDQYREQRDATRELKQMLVEEGGIGGHQADAIVNGFINDIKSSVDAYMGAASGLEAAR